MAVVGGSVVGVVGGSVVGVVGGGPVVGVVGGSVGRGGVPPPEPGLRVVVVAGRQVVVVMAGLDLEMPW